MVGGIVNEWISVENRLPNKNKRVLAVIKGIITDKYIDILCPCDFKQKKWIIEDWESGETVDYEVTYWQPLPQIPR